MTTATQAIAEPAAGVSVAQPPAQASISAPPPPAVMENGGATSTSWGEYVKKINWVEVGFMILGTAAFLYMIRYYKYRLYTDRDSVKNLERRCDELKADIVKMKTPKKQSRGGF